MADAQFLDRNNPPDQEMIYKTIGEEVLPVWKSLWICLDNNFPEYESELIFYNPQHGWGFRFRKEAQQLCVLFPERGAFEALITLNPEEEASAQEKINFFNARIRELLNQPSTLPQGRWLWIRLEDHTDFVGVRLLLEIKAS